MIVRVEEVRKEEKNIWEKIIMSNCLYNNGVQKDETSHLVAWEGVSGDQKDETQTKGYPEDQSLDADISHNPPLETIDIVGEVPVI